jgi:hypothetical protein
LSYPHEMCMAIDYYFEPASVVAASRYCLNSTTF